MKTKIVCKCDGCGFLIACEDDGVIVQGNIYTANPDNIKNPNKPTGGLIGNIRDLGPKAYCLDCFLDYILKPLGKEYLLKKDGE